MGLWYVGLGAAGTNAAAAAGDDDDADIAACITSLQDLIKNGRAQGSKLVYIYPYTWGVGGGFVVCGLGCCWYKCCCCCW